MTHYLEGKSVYHTIQRWDRTAGMAKADCGVTGEPVEADPDPEDVCGRCQPDDG